MKYQMSHCEKSVCFKMCNMQKERENGGGERERETDRSIDVQTETRKRTSLTGGSESECCGLTTEQSLENLTVKSCARFCLEVKRGSILFVAAILLVSSSSLYNTSLNPFALKALFN